jgi:choline dehydrogenase-like flavoprotein
MLADAPQDGLGKGAYGAIVIGSGFGGAVVACRLSQAGVYVALIERGARFPLGGSAYLGDSARRAADSIPSALNRTLPGQFHDVDPQTLAAELTTFLER